MAITAREQAQIDAANAAARRRSSSSTGSGCCQQLGQLGRVLRGDRLRAVTPDWPDDPETVEEARANPDVFAKKTLKQIADHTAEVIGALDKKPAVMGHSTGGLLTQMIADRGLSAASVAIDPGPFRGVLPLPISALQSALPGAGTRSTAAARSRSPSTSSSTAGRTRSTRTRPSSSTRPTTSPRRESR